MHCFTIIIYTDIDTIGKSKFTLYHGQWECGLKNGTGLEIDDSGIYSGQYFDGYRTGRGRLDLADGTMIKGDFEKHENFPSRQNSIVFSNNSMTNPYIEG